MLVSIWYAFRTKSQNQNSISLENFPSTWNHSVKVLLIGRCTHLWTPDNTFFTFWIKLKNVLFSLFYNATVHSCNCALFYFAWPNLNFHVDMFDEWLNDTAKQNNTKTKHGSCPIKTVRLINKRRRISTKKNTIVLYGLYQSYTLTKGSFIIQRILFVSISMFAPVFAVLILFLF